jgi:hypothetical protein
MTGWLRRFVHDPGPEDASPAEDPDDRPEALLQRHAALVQTVNRSAGRLPAEAVVLARGVLDAVRAVITIAGERELDVRAAILARGILGDYLPTTLQTYLALDPAVAAAPGASGATPAELLVDQLTTLENSALDLLDAARARDVDALASQGSFLRTKFTGSDLDL